jgi:two-component system, OmpR family, response regulator
MRMLVVEDETKMANLLRRGLQEQGYVVDIAGTGKEAVWRAIENDYDLVVLDVMLPDGDGFQVCREIRESGQWMPMLMLTARDAHEDRVRGLDGGADDYLTKPFAFDELLARIRALLRRDTKERPAVLSVGGLTLDPATREVTREGVAIELTSKEFSLLEYLMREVNRTVSRAELIEHVWDLSHEGNSNIVDVYVGYLRQKIDRPFDTQTIVTVTGAGYRVGHAPDSPS